jgi:hypothetical protein
MHVFPAEYEVSPFVQALTTAQPPFPSGAIPDAQPHDATTALAAQFSQTHVVLPPTHLMTLPASYASAEHGRLQEIYINLSIPSTAATTSTACCVANEDAQ